MTECRHTDLSSLVAMIPRRAVLGIGGFQLNRAPMAIVAELVSQRIDGLRVVSAPNPLPLDALTAAGLVEEAECGFIGFQYDDGFVTAPAIRRAVENRQLRLHERDVYETLQGLRAAALGLPFLPLAGAPASDYPDGPGIIRHGEGTPGMMRCSNALRLDVAILHVQAADMDGNLRIDDPHADPLLALASERVIATAEEQVEKVRDPAVPGHRVAGVTILPGGAYPTSCYGHYARSPTGIHEHLEASSASNRRAMVSVQEPRTPPAETSDHASGSADAHGLAATRDTDSRDCRAVTASARSASDVQPMDRVLAAMARTISDCDVVTTGVASASAQLATELARRTSAPGLRYINCVGAVDPLVPVASHTSVDPSLLDDCASRISLPQVFDCACRGEVDLMFFGAAQIDARARLNLTCIGPYSTPDVKLAGPAGSPTMRSLVRKVVITIPRHSPRTLVREVDFVTSAPSINNQSTTLITNLGIFHLQEGHLCVVSRHEGVSAAELRTHTGFPVEGEMGNVTPEPSLNQMDLLHQLDPLGIRYQWG